VNPGLDLAADAGYRFDLRVVRLRGARAASAARTEALLFGSFGQAEVHHLLSLRLP
jgi:hypothetical protein